MGNKDITGQTCALFWDESFLWGLMVWRSLRKAGLPFDLIRSHDIRAGKLSRYAMLFVPGEWASAELHALGEKGQSEIRSFVAKGGRYLGICGGAGMATESGLALLGVHRRPTKDRVPSFSGPIRLSLTDHAIWTASGRPPFMPGGRFNFISTQQRSSVFLPDMMKRTMMLTVLIFVSVMGGLWAGRNWKNDTEYIWIPTD